ncbi:hypothetical protein [Thauera chlorobenzoica]|uniref:Uncharacterized protein n=1 Tax=Thauera chlorobenzoica TaxID=96773 RepID=A0A1H5UW16_9RHOO|nr:hypothetical protein [Thauera chlorobenzoica]APR05353.1 hypothetical protein Tchl_2527 [Thauera chlorobenzoica]SEF79259.1 hypothetical protein SAMN05216242_10630 [Thauera chlorobenzoica]
MLIHRHLRGIALLEGLISVVVLSVGILALGKLDAHMLGAAGLTKARAEAAQLAQAEIEALRTQVLKSSFDGIGDQPTTSVAGKNALFTVLRTVTDLNTTLKRIDVTVSWVPPANWGSPTDGGAGTDSVTVRTLLNWSDPKLLIHLEEGVPGYENALHPPIGLAKRPAVPIQREAGEAGVYNDGDKRELRDTAGNVLLVLDPIDKNNPREFATISGRIYFDTDRLKSNFQPAKVLVASTAEGHCFPSTSASIALTTVPDTGGKLKYYEYKCYVGEGWYANIAIQNLDTNEVNVCVGDPTFTTSSSMNYWTTLPMAQPASRRVYRGYKSLESAATGYFITGIANGGTYPEDGMPKPSHFSSYSTSSTTQNYFNHHFLITDLKAQDSCQSVMSGFSTHFHKNAGAALCLSPDDSPADDKCPKIWPGWPTFIDAGAGDFGGGDSGEDDGSGGSANTCSGTVSGSTESSGAKVSATSSVETVECATSGGNIKNYTCGITAAEGSTTVTVSQTSGNTTVTKTLLEPFVCNAINTLNFP